MSGAAPTRPARARSLLCPQCGAPVVLRASGSTVSAVCPNCTAVLDVGTDDSLRLVAAAQERTRRPAIPIGTRGTLDGTEWEVVGFQVRSVQAGSWTWEEFLLFNPFQGFRFLAGDHGDWTLYALLRRDLSDGAPAAYAMGETATARTDYVLGEFYWRVRVGDEVQVREYRDPPAVLSEEWTGTERTWSEGRTLDAATVRTAFGVPDLPGRAGPDGPQSLGGTWATAAAACVLLGVLSVVPFGQYRNQVVLRQALEARDAADQVVAEFTLPGAGGSLELEASSSFTGTPATGQVRLLPVPGGPGNNGLTAAVQFGGAFGDGDTQRATFAAVPGGRYRLSVELDTPDFHAAPEPSGTADPFTSLLRQAGVPPPAPDPAAPAVTVPVTVVLRRHPPSPGAVVVTLLAILAWPVVRSVVRWARRQRWDEG